MKTKIIALLILALPFTKMSAQDTVSDKLGIEDFIKAPGKIIVISTVFEDKFSGTGEMYISLIKSYEFGASDTMYGIKFKAILNSSYYAYMDTDELERVIRWMELVRKGGAWTYSKEAPISYAPNKSNLILSYSKDLFVFQMSVYDDNSNFEYSNGKMEEIYQHFKKIQAILLKISKSKK